jgi:hypothetical protein
MRYTHDFVGGDDVIRKGLLGNTQLSHNYLFW